MLHNELEINNSTEECSDEQVKTVVDLTLLRLKAVNMCLDKSLRAIFQWCRNRSCLESANSRSADESADSPIVGRPVNDNNNNWTQFAMRISPFSTTLKPNSDMEMIPAANTISLWNYKVAIPFNFSLKMKVSSNDISIHIPLHRFLSKVFVAATFNNINLQEVINSLHSAARRIEVTDTFNTLEALFYFADYPLRCLTFAAQINAGMWRRNGSAVHLLGYNYDRPPLNRSMKCMDLLPLQLLALTVSPDAAILLSVFRMELNSFLEDFPGFYEKHMKERTNRDKDTFKPQLLSELLRIFIHTITNTPISLVNVSAQKQCVERNDRDSSAHNEGLKTVVYRELVHQALCFKSKIGLPTAGQLMERAQRLIGFGGHYFRTFISDSYLKTVVNEVAESQRSTGSSGNLLSLNADKYCYYDPEFSNLTDDEASHAAEKIKQRLLMQTSVDVSGLDNFKPLMCKESIPTPHYDFRSIRSMLYRPLLFDILSQSLAICQIDADSKFPAEIMKAMLKEILPHRLTIIGRVLHLITLQIHCQMDSTADFDSYMHGLQADSRNWSSGANYFSTGFESSDSSQSGDGFKLLQQLAKLWNSSILKDETLYRHALGWILKQIWERSDHGRIYMTSVGIMFTTNAAVSNGSSEKARQAAADLRKLSAQQRALEEANRRAAVFAAMIADSDDEDNSDKEETIKSTKLVDSADVVAAEEKHAFKCDGMYSNPSERCIICKSKASATNSMGYLCFIQPSQVLKNMLLNPSNASSPQLRNVYRVVRFDNSCCVYFSATENETSVLCTLSLGTHVLAEERVGRWIRISAPIAGWVPIYGLQNKKKGPKTGKPKNASIDDESSWKFAVFLHPVSDLQWFRHGSLRPHMSSCGHAMHLNCFETFHIKECNRNFMNHPHIALNDERNELLCPLCKTITNSILPIYADVQIMPVTPSTSSHNVSEMEEKNEHTLELFAHSNTIKSDSEIDTNKVMALQFLDSVLDCNNLDGKSEHLSTQTIQASVDSLMKKNSDDCRLAKFSNLLFYYPKLQGLYSTWAALAYTLLTASVCQIKERGCDVLPSSRPLASKPTLPSNDCSILYHTMRYLRQVPFMRPSSNESNGLFLDFVVHPLHSAIFGINNSKLGELPVNPEYIPLDVEECNEAVIRQGILSLSQHANLSNTVTIIPTRLGTINYYTGALDRIVKKDEADFAALSEVMCPSIHLPLLAQDLHTFAIASASSAKDLKSFMIINSFVCIARLAQAMIEPNCSAQYSDYNSSKVLEKQYVNTQQQDNDSVSPSSQLTKRLKMSSNSKAKNQKIAAMDGDAKIDHEMESFGLSLQTLRERICKAAGVPFAPMESLLEAALDSWIPYLEFSYHLRSAMIAICVQQIGSSTSDEYLQYLMRRSHDIGDDVHCHTQSDCHTKYQHTLWLCRMLDVPSMQTMLESSLEGTILNWAYRFQRFHGGRQNFNAPTNCNPTVDSAQSKDSKSINSSGSSSMIFNDEKVDTENDNEGSDDEEEVEADVDQLPNMFIGNEIQFLNENGDYNSDEEIDEIDVVDTDEFDSARMNFEEPYDHHHSPAANDIDSDVFGAALLKKHWRLVGIDPSNKLVDETDGGSRANMKTCMFVDMSSEIVKVALHGDVSGMATILGVDGMPVLQPYPDLSHMGISLRNLKSCLIDLPFAYLDLYQKAKFPGGTGNCCVDEPAICLACGRVVHAGNREGLPTQTNPGECTLHARKCGGGVAVFYLVQQYTVLLIRDSRCCYMPHLTLYLDSHGEIPDSSKSSCRPLFLSAERYAQLGTLYLRHGVVKEVVRRRSSDDRVIRANYY
eukprot:CAMPEP_0170101252 /NCGR_PEP_ID=MMETSP0020_2-20130122/2148_1 /TAXON_ID=98059 /ORGANISM="Dinobryon sp., Strain UTEXLB2267" /LENGTH=1808 /DNA_ID=CAMNT_0010324313 /DNA_START=870 /DNA_END=6296 /DNA_ORIENTATION=+